MSRLIQTRSETISSNNLQKISSDLDKKIVVIRLIDAIGFFLFENNRLTSVNVYDENYSVGHIIVGRVINVKKEISAVFISLSDNTDAFCKLSNVPERYFPLHQGDLIPVKIIAEAQKGKRVSITANISEKNIDPSWKYKSAFSNCGIANTLETFIKSNFTIDECKSLITDDSKIYDKLANVNCLTSSNISLYSDEKLPLSKLYSLKTKLSEGLNNKVFLKCGGYLIINKTEALTVIDVNSGKNVSSKKAESEDIIYNINSEAAKEISIQLRLRNISGMILIDFINMASDESKSNLIALMNEYTSADKAHTMVIDITPLGIMELTRQKKNKPLSELTDYFDI